MTTKFQKDLIVGSKGEILMYSYLKSLNNVHSILDVSKIPKFQEIDVDFLVTTEDGKEVWVEVKYDRQTDGSKNYEPTRRIAYEVSSNGNEGCLARSKADYVYYITTQRIYCFSLKKIREYIGIAKPNLRVMGDGAKGYILDINDLIKANVLHIVKELDGNVD